MIVRLLLLLIRGYQRFLSPLLGGQCRFYPSCSRYAYACIEGHGAVRGTLLSVVRVCKCHPFHPGGHDPPPPRLATHEAPSVTAPPERHRPAVRSGEQPELPDGTRLDS